MKILSIILVSITFLSSCTFSKAPIVESPKSNNIDIGNKTITTITGSYVQPIR